MSSNKVIHLITIIYYLNSNRLYLVLDWGPWYRNWYSSSLQASKLLEVRFLGFIQTNTKALYSGYRISFPWVKRPGSDAGYPPSHSSADADSVNPTEPPLRVTGEPLPLFWSILSYLRDFLFHTIGCLDCLHRPQICYLPSTDPCPWWLSRLGPQECYAHLFMVCT
jgi:hypothetical protein